jgi:hypothetical protein
VGSVVKKRILGHIRARFGNPDFDGTARKKNDGSLLCLILPLTKSGRWPRFFFQRFGQENDLLGVQVAKNTSQNSVLLRDGRTHVHVRRTTRSSHRKAATLTDRR